jgi:hypothetical protein
MPFSAATKESLKFTIVRLSIAALGIGEVQRNLKGRLAATQAAD